MAVRTPKTKEVIRERKFRVIGRSRKHETIDLVCNYCAHEFTIKTSQENFFFRCQNLGCSEKSNLQDVLVLETQAIPNKKDNETFGITDEERTKLISELLQLHPHPEREGNP